MPERQKASQIQRIVELSGDRDKSRQVITMRVGMWLGMGLAVRAPRTASLGASAQSLVDDGFDGARATAAFGAAAEATVDLLGIPGKVFRAIDRVADIVVGKDIAGTNNHGNDELFDDDTIEILKTITGCKRKKPDFK